MEMEPSQARLHSLAVSLEPRQLAQSDTDSDNDEKLGCIHIHPKSLPLPNLVSDLELRAAEIKKSIEAIQVNLTSLILHLVYLNFLGGNEIF